MFISIGLFIFLVLMTGAAITYTFLFTLAGILQKKNTEESSESEVEYIYDTVKRIEYQLSCVISQCEIKEKEHPKFSGYSENLPLSTLVDGATGKGRNVKVGDSPTFKCVYIINDADRRIGCADVYKNTTVEEAISAYAEIYGKAADGVCLAYDGGSWYFCGYVGELIDKVGSSNEKI